MDTMSSNSSAVWIRASDEVQISEVMVVYFDGWRGALSMGRCPTTSARLPVETRLIERQVCRRLDCSPAHGLAGTTTCAQPRRQWSTE
jgi:hypothetical protein